jgi:hypothetical protein
MGNRIPNKRIFRTAGDEDSTIQSFFNNNFLFNRSQENEPLEYSIPQVSAATGTYNLYGQDPKSILAMYGRPNFPMVFTSNTSVFTADTRFVRMYHNIYKIDSEDVYKYYKNPTEKQYEIIKNKIVNSYVSYTALSSSLATISSTTSTYNLYPSQFDKAVGGFTQELFSDRSQYFLDTRFVFSTTGSAYSEAFTYSDDTENIIPFNYSNSGFFDTGIYSQQITKGPWSGNTANGMFFVCFQPPNKPIVEFPFPDSANTFTPTFNFSNVEDGDEFFLQVTYTMTDSGFTQTTGVTSYSRQKTVDNIEQIVDKTNQNVVGQDSTTSKRTRRINASLFPNSQYWYRIGNVKGIVDVFGGKKEIVTYSEPYSAITDSRFNIETFVDSNNVSAIREQTDESGRIVRTPIKFIDNVGKEGS